MSDSLNPPLPLSSSGHNVPILLDALCQNVSYLSFLSCRKKTDHPASSCSPAHFKPLHPAGGFVIPLSEPLPSFWSCVDIRVALLNLYYLPPIQLSACSSCAERCDDQPVPLLVGSGNPPSPGPVCKLPKLPRKFFSLTKSYLHLLQSGQS